MKSLRILSLAAGLVALLLGASGANAAQQMLCAPQASARVVTNYSSSASPQPSYNLNARGCALIQQADIGFFLTQGYTGGPAETSFIYTTGVLTGTTDVVIGSIPPGAYIQEIVYSNSVAAAITGGISLGTTANGTDVVAAQAVGSSALTFTPSASVLKQVFSTTAATPIHAAAVTAWNSANVTITIAYSYF